MVTSKCHKIIYSGNIFLILHQVLQFQRKSLHIKCTKQFNNLLKQHKEVQFKLLISHMVCYKCKLHTYLIVKYWITVLHQKIHINTYMQYSGESYSREYFQLLASSHYQYAEFPLQSLWPPFLTQVASQSSETMKKQCADSDSLLSFFNSGIE